MALSCPPVQGGKRARGAARPLFSLPLAGEGRGGGRVRGKEREWTLRRPRRRTRLADKQNEKCGSELLSPDLANEEVAEDGDALRMPEFLGIDEEGVEFRALDLGDDPRHP